MKHFYTRWEQRNKQERLELLSKFIKPIFINKELRAFLIKVVESISSVDEKIYYLEFIRKVLAQTNRQPDYSHYKAFEDQYNNLLKDIKQEQKIHNPITWIDAELQYQHFMKSIKPVEGNPQPIDFNKKWLTAQEMAKYLGIGKSTLERKVAFGLPQEKFGRRVFYSPEKVNDWLAIQNN